LLASAEAHEEVLMQRLQDLEARDVFAQLGDYRLLQEEQDQALQDVAPIPLLPERVNSGSFVPVLEDTVVDEEEEDLENLEEYEEYR